MDTNEAANSLEYKETVTKEQRQDTQVENSKENGLLKELERKLLILEKEFLKTKTRITMLEKENAILVEKLKAGDQKIERMAERTFDLERFKCDDDILFYTGFPNYVTFLATFEYLNPELKGRT